MPDKTARELELHKKTVKELREILVDRGEKVAGVKKDLVQRVLESDDQTRATESASSTIETVGEEDVQEEELELVSEPVDVDPVDWTDPPWESIVEAVEAAERITMLPQPFDVDVNAKPELEPIVPNPNARTKLPDAGQPPTVKRIFESYERRPQFRGGALSVGSLGDECERKIWYKWRWALPVEFEGRTLRIFDTGNREEVRFVEELRSIGVQVWATRAEQLGAPWTVRQYGAEFHVFDPFGNVHSSHGTSQKAAENEAATMNAKQIKATFLDGHVGQRSDGVALGFDEAPRTAHLLEFKTSNEKGFRELEKLGVRTAKPEHYGQCQLGMLGLGLSRCYYLVTNKDTDEIYGERVEFSRQDAEGFIAKALEIIQSAGPPDRIGSDATFWKCKFCDFPDICHRSRAPEPNCRTCIHSTPVLDGSGRDVGAWICEYGGGSFPLDKSRQEIGCPKHLFIPGLLEPELSYVRPEPNAGRAPRFLEYHDRDGNSVFNVTEETLSTLDPSAPRNHLDRCGFSSREFYENPISTSTNYAELRRELSEIPF